MIHSEIWNETNRDDEHPLEEEKELPTDQEAPDSILPHY